MSMRENPSGGYVVPLNQLKGILSADKQVELDKLIEDMVDGEEIVDFLNPLMKELGFPEVESVWYADEDFASDDLEQDQFYASFAEDDLFVITPKDAFNNMKAKKMAPKLSYWTVLG